jgi:chromosome segregation ATPase
MLSGDYCSKWLQKHLPSGEFIGFKIEDLTKAQVEHLEDRIESLEEKIESLTETNYSITRSLSDLSTRIFKAKARELRLLKVLECYADDGDAGPGSPVLPARDVKLRGFAVSLIHEIEGDKK